MPTHSAAPVTRSGVQAVEYLPEPVALGADEPVGVDPDVVEEEG